MSSKDHRDFQHAQALAYSSMVHAIHRADFLRGDLHSGLKSSFMKADDCLVSAASDQQNLVLKQAVALAGHQCIACPI